MLPGTEHEREASSSEPIERELPERAVSWECSSLEARARAQRGAWRCHLRPT
jgi:hypothetical protein